MAVNHYATYHNPANFVAPEEFLPERWLAKSETSCKEEAYYAHGKHRHDDVLQPFGYGPRECLGQTMALHEMRLILAHVLVQFDLVLCDPTDNWLDQRVFVLWEKKPLMCLVRFRDHRSSKVCVSDVFR